MSALRASAWRDGAEVLLSLALVAAWLGAWLAAFIVLPGPWVAPATIALVLAFAAVHFRGRRRQARLALRAPPPRLAPIALAVVVLDSALMALQARFPGLPAEAYEWLYELAAAPWGWLILGVSAVVAAPVIEETAFRGWIQGRLRRRWGPAPAVLAAAALFAAAHASATLFPYYLLLGAVLGWAVVVLRSLWAAIALHALVNLASLAWIVALPDPEALRGFVDRPEVTVAAGLAALAAAFTLAAIHVRSEWTARRLRD